MIGEGQTVNASMEEENESNFRNYDYFKFLTQIIEICHVVFAPVILQRAHVDVDSTWILHRYVEDQISTNFHVISTYFFDLTSLIEKFTSLPRTFFDIISLVEKTTLFPHTFFGVISLVEKSSLFTLTFFDVILMVEKSTLFTRIFFNETSMDKTRRRL